jgi:hypothetical protein
MPFAYQPRKQLRLRPLPLPQAEIFSAEIFFFLKESKRREKQMTELPDYPYDDLELEQAKRLAKKVLADALEKEPRLFGFDYEVDSSEGHRLFDALNFLHGDLLAWARTK